MSINFFVVYTFFVELANQTKACLKLWEMVCKAVSHIGCEKLGRRISFKICMEEKNIFRLPIYRFLGNRFNILFINAAGL